MKDAQSKVLARCKLLEMILANSPMGIMLMEGPDATVTLLSPYAKKISPYLLTLGRSAFSAAPVENVESLMSDYQRVYREGETLKILDRLIVDKYYTYIQTRVQTPDMSHGVLVIGYETSELVFQRRELELRIEAQVKEHQSAYRFLDAIVENIPDMIFVKEAEFLKFVRFNKAGEELLGYSREELLGKSDFDFFPLSEAEHFIQKDRGVLAQNQVLDISEEFIHTRYKGVRTLHTKKIPIVDDDGNARYLLGISEDITEKKLAEKNRLNLEHEQNARASAEGALKMRDDFISIAAHELKTPLTALKLQFASLGKFKGDIPPDQLKKYSDHLHRAEEQCDRFARLITDLLDVSQANSGKLMLQLSDTNLVELLCGVIKRYEPTAMRAGCPLCLEAEPVEINGHWDCSRIEQVAENLLGNAIKYGAGKPIRIAASAKDDGVELVVQDRGIGIAAEDQVRIFERFERAVSPREFGGLGLGLYISQQIINAHGGKIWVDSEIGKGSSFHVRIPLRCQAENFQKAG